MTAPEPTSTDCREPRRVVDGRPAPDDTWDVSHILTLNSLRAVDRRARTVARVEGINPPTPNELSGRPRRKPRQA